MACTKLKCELNRFLSNHDSTKPVRSFCRIHPALKSDHYLSFLSSVSFLVDKVIILCKTDRNLGPSDRSFRSKSTSFDLGVEKTQRSHL